MFFQQVIKILYLPAHMYKQADEPSIHHCIKVHNYVCISLYLLVVFNVTLLTAITGGLESITTLH